MHENKGQRNFIACLLVSRLVDIFLNKYMQNAYEGDNYKKRILTGKDSFQKHWVVMFMFCVALVYNLNNMVFDPSMNNKHLIQISLRYCFLALDDGFGAITHSGWSLLGLNEKARPTMTRYAYSKK